MAQSDWVLYSESPRDRIPIGGRQWGFEDTVGLLGDRTVGGGGGWKSELMASCARSPKAPPPMLVAAIDRSPVGRAKTLQSKPRAFDSVQYGTLVRVLLNMVVPVGTNKAQGEKDDIGMRICASCAWLGVGCTPLPHLQYGTKVYCK